MRSQSPHRPRPFRRPLLPIALLIAGCSPATSDDPAIYTEWEPNDDALSANDFGVLYPGDFFYIDGNSSDDGSDPFDGFAFVAGGPVHVDFRLFDDPYSSDLDVWLYDAQLGEVVGYYETEQHPETGGVDIVAGGLEFHLMVRSYFGRSDYTLEIAVSPLPVTFASSSAGIPGGPAAAPGLSTVGASPQGQRGGDASAYAAPTPATPSAPRQATLTQEFDASEGLLIEVLRLPPSALVE